MAQKLGRTVEELRSSISALEFLYWTRYYAIRQQRDELEMAKARG